MIFSPFTPGAITEAASLFNYTSDKPFSHYNDKTFVPLFSDEFNQTEKDAANAACQPDPTNACIVDYLMTKDETLAQSSGDVQSNSGNLTSNLGKYRKHIAIVTLYVGKSALIVYRYSRNE